MKTKNTFALLAALLSPALFLVLGSISAHGATVISSYGDDDGFGIGATSGTLNDPFTSNAGDGEVTTGGFFTGAVGVQFPSNDLAQIIVEFYEYGNGGTLLGTAQTTPVDPIPGFWNEVSIAATAIPSSTDTLVYCLKTTLDLGFSSIDIGGDDFSLSVTPEPSRLLLSLLSLGAVLVRRRR